MNCFMKRNKGADQLCGYHAYVFEYAKVFSNVVDHKYVYVG